MKVVVAVFLLFLFEVGFSVFLWDASVALLFFYKHLEGEVLKELSV